MNPRVRARMLIDQLPQGYVKLIRGEKGRSTHHHAENVEDLVAVLLDVIDKLEAQQGYE